MDFVRRGVLIMSRRSSTRDYAIHHVGQSFGKILNLRTWVLLLFCVILSACGAPWPQLDVGDDEATRTADFPMLTPMDDLLMQVQRQTKTNQNIFKSDEAEREASSIILGRNLWPDLANHKCRVSRGIRQHHKQVGDHNLTFPQFCA